MKSTPSGDWAQMASMVARYRSVAPGLLLAASQRMPIESGSAARETMRTNGWASAGSYELAPVFSMPALNPSTPVCQHPVSLHPPFIMSTNTLFLTSLCQFGSLVTFFHRKDLKAFDKRARC